MYHDVGYFISVCSMHNQKLFDQNITNQQGTDKQETKDQEIDLVEDIKSLNYASVLWMDISKIRSFLKKIFEQKNIFDPKRRDILKMSAVAIWAALIWGCDLKNTFESDPSQKNIRKLCELKDLKNEGWKKQSDYEHKYHTPKLSDNNTRMNRKIEKQKVILWFHSMIALQCEHDWVTKTHLEMIIDLAHEYDVPKEIVFLALAESARTADAQSWANAHAYRQFQPATVRWLWWKVKDMSDPVKSTELAMSLFKQNQKRVQLYLKKYCSGQYSKDTELKYTLAHHNCSPKMIKRWIKNWEGDFNNHYTTIWKYPHWKWYENALYVARILWIKNALRWLVNEWSFHDLWVVKQPNNSVENNHKNLSNADRLFERYENESNNMSQKNQENKLEKIVQEYDIELKKWVISKEYHEDALEYVQEKIGWIEAKKDKIAEENQNDNEDIWYVKLNKSQDQRYQIYLYAIKKSATKDILFDKFKHEENSAADISKFIITDINGIEYEDKKFKKWEKLFIRYRIHNTFERIKSWVYKVTIKKSATPSLLKDKFLQEYPYTKNIKVCNEKWIEYTKRTFFASWDVVYIKIN